MLPNGITDIAFVHAVASHNVTRVFLNSPIECSYPGFEACVGVCHHAPILMSPTNDEKRP